MILFGLLQDKISIYITKSGHIYLLYKKESDLFSCLDFSKLDVARQKALEPVRGVHKIYVHISRG